MRIWWNGLVEWTTGIMEQWNGILVQEYCDYLKTGELRDYWDTEEA